MPEKFPSQEDFDQIRTMDQVRAMFPGGSVSDLISGMQQVDPKVPPADVLGILARVSWGHIHPTPGSGRPSLSMDFVAKNLGVSTARLNALINREIHGTAAGRREDIAEASAESFRTSLKEPETPVTGPASLLGRAATTAIAASPVGWPGMAVADGTLPERFAESRKMVEQGLRGSALVAARIHPAARMADEQTFGQALAPNVFTPEVLKNLSETAEGRALLTLSRVSSGIAAQVPWMPLEAAQGLRGAGIALSKGTPVLKQAAKVGLRGGLQAAAEAGTMETVGQLLDIAGVGGSTEDPKNDISRLADVASAALGAGIFGGGLGAAGTTVSGGASGIYWLVKANRELEKVKAFSGELLPKLEAVQGQIANRLREMGIREAEERAIAKESFEPAMKLIRFLQEAPPVEKRWSPPGRSGGQVFTGPDVYEAEAALRRQLGMAQKPRADMPPVPPDELLTDYSREAIRRFHRPATHYTDVSRTMAKFAEREIEDLEDWMRTGSTKLREEKLGTPAIDYIKRATPEGVAEDVASGETLRLDRLIETTPSPYGRTKASYVVGSDIDKIISRNAIPTERLARQLGEEGWEFAESYQGARARAELKNGSFDQVLYFEPIRAAKEGDLLKMRQVLEGKLPPANDAQARIFDAWTKIREDIAREAREVGLKILDPRTGKEIDFFPMENYFPRVMKKSVLKVWKKGKLSGQAMMIKRMMEANPGLDEGQAKAVLENWVQPRALKRNKNLEMMRLYDLPPEWIENDIRKIIPEYTRNARRRIEEARTFGRDYSGAYTLAAKLDAKGMSEESELLNAIIDVTLAGKQPPGKTPLGLTRKLRGFMVVTALDLAGPTNLGEMIKPYAATGNLGSSLKAMAQVAGETRPSFGLRGLKFSPTQASLRAGLDPEHLGEGVKNLGEDTWANWTLEFGGTKPGEHAAQMTTVQAAINHANLLARSVKEAGVTPDMVKRLADASMSGNLPELRKAMKEVGPMAMTIRQLAKYTNDLEGVIDRGVLSREETNAVGQKVLARYFPRDVIDIPFDWLDAGGKLRGQFMSFGVKWLDSLRADAITDARLGHPERLIKLAIVGTAVGVPIDALKMWVRGKGGAVKYGRLIMEDPVNEVPRAILKALLTIGGLGIATDVLMGVKYNTGGFFSSLISGAAVQEQDSMYEEVIKGDPQKLLTRATRAIPFFGEATARKGLPLLFPEKDPETGEFGIKRKLPRAETTLPIAEQALTLGTALATGGPRKYSTVADVKLGPLSMTRAAYKENQVAREIRALNRRDREIERELKRATGERELALKLERERIESAVSAKENELEALLDKLVTSARKRKAKREAGK